MKPTAYFMIALLCTGILYGCDKQGKPARKKIPEQFSADGVIPFQSHVEKTAGWPVYTSDISLAGGGGSTTDYLYVSFPDTAGDSLLIQTLVSHSSVALPLFSKWAEQQQRGIMIDLRSSGADSRQAEYAIDLPHPVPVVFVWDRSTTARAKAFIAVLQSMPGIHVHATARNNSNTFNF